jgi:hypothetical protein
MSHHDDATEHPLTADENPAAEPAVKDGTDPNDLVVSDDIDQQMLSEDLQER